MRACARPVVFSLQGLVDDAHARGIAVLLDVVYNHAGYDSDYLDDPRTHAWLRVGPERGGADLTSCLSGLPDFKTELPEVADYLLRAHVERAERVGLDGSQESILNDFDARGGRPVVLPGVVPAEVE